MTRPQIISNPDLTVGKDNKQRWNQVAHRRHGFHNAHRLFRRSLMIRSRNVLMLEPAAGKSLDEFPALAELLAESAFSAFCCLRDNNIILEAAAPDFSTTVPHSIQSITKLHIHFIIGRLLEQGLLSLDGCENAWLDTHEFQARGFYESNGYTLFGELPDYPKGHARYFMRKACNDS